MSRRENEKATEIWTKRNPTASLLIKIASRRACWSKWFFFVEGGGDLECWCLNINPNPRRPLKKNVKKRKKWLNEYNGKLIARTPKKKTSKKLMTLLSNCQKTVLSQQLTVEELNNFRHVFFLMQIKNWRYENQRSTKL